MNKRDFVFWLFDNGKGLTLDQIQTIEDNLPDLMDEGMIEDIRNQFPEESEEKHREIASDLCRDFLASRLQDCADFLELRDYLTATFNINPSDMQIFYLYNDAR